MPKERSNNLLVLVTSEKLWVSDQRKQYYMLSKVITYGWFVFHFYLKLYLLLELSL